MCRKTTQRDNFRFVPHVVTRRHGYKIGLLWAAVARRVPDGGDMAWAGIGEIASDLGLSERGLRNWIEAAEDAGVLEVDPGYGGHLDTAWALRYGGRVFRKDRAFFDRGEWIRISDAVWNAPLSRPATLLAAYLQGLQKTTRWAVVSRTTGIPERTMRRARAEVRDMWTLGWTNTPSGATIRASLPTALPARTVAAPGMVRQPDCRPSAAGTGSDAEEVADGDRHTSHATSSADRSERRSQANAGTTATVAERLADADGQGEQAGAKPDTQQSRSQGISGTTGDVSEELAGEGIRDVLPDGGGVFRNIWPVVSERLADRPLRSVLRSVLRKNSSSAPEGAGERPRDTAEAEDWAAQTALLLLRKKRNEQLRDQLTSDQQRALKERIEADLRGSGYDVPAFDRCVNADQHRRALGNLREELSYKDPAAMKSVKAWYGKHLGDIRDGDRRSRQAAEEWLENQMSTVEDLLEAADEDAAREARQNGEVDRVRQTLIYGVLIGRKDAVLERACIGCQVGDRWHGGQCVFLPRADHSWRSGRGEDLIEELRETLGLTDGQDDEDSYEPDFGGTVDRALEREKEDTGEGNADKTEGPAGWTLDDVRDERDREGGPRAYMLEVAVLSVSSLDDEEVAIAAAQVAADQGKGFAYVVNRAQKRCTTDPLEAEPVLDRADAGDDVPDRVGDLVDPTREHAVGAAS